MTVTTRRPMLDGTIVKDVHERIVTVRLADTEPYTTGTYRRGVEIRFEPRYLKLSWKGSPAQLRGVWISGPELTKSGAVNARGLTSGHNFLRHEYEWGTDPADGRQRRSAPTFELAEDTPDWIRELIAQYTPDWPELAGAQS